MGFPGLLGFFLLANGCGVKACSSPLPSPHFQGPQFLFQPHQQHQSLQLGALPSFPQGFPRGAQQEWFRIRPIHLEKSRHSSSSHPESLIPLGQVGSQGGVWVATGHPSPAHWPSQMTLGSLSSKVLVSPGIPRAWFQPQFAGMRFQCHRMMQHLQKRCRLPPTEGGGVTGAK